MNKLNFNEIDIRVLSQSQKGQDSIIKYIFDNLGTTNKYYVEFGAADGIQMCNTYYFKAHEGWSGLLLDRSFENPLINLHKRILTKENINLVFKEFNVEKEFDFLCIDTDGNDYWFLSELLKEYSPRVIMVETNVRFEPLESKVLKYDPDWSWDGRDWYGGSPYAFKKMANQYGYTPVYIHIDDMFLVRNDLLHPEDVNKDWSLVYNSSNKPLYNDHIGKPGMLPIIEEDTSKWIEI